MSFSAALLLMAAALKGTLNAADRTEIRAVDSTGNVSAAVDIQTTPSLLATLAIPDWNFSLGYFPQLTLHFTYAATTLELLHSGRFSASWFGRRYRMTLNQDISYGGLVFSGLLSQSLRSGNAAQIQSLPAADRISILSYRSELAMSTRLSRRTDILSSAAISGSGGADDASRAVLPSQFGPRVSFGLQHTLSRRTSLQSSAALSFIAFSTGAEFGSIDARIQGQYRISRKWTALAGTGLSANSSRVSRDSADEYLLYPTADASLAFRMPENRLEGGFGARLSPVLDRVRAALDQRIDTTVYAIFRATPRFSTRSSVDLAQSIPPLVPNALTSLSGELTFIYQPTRAIELSLGFRGAWQSLRGEDNPFGSWLIHTNVLFQAPVISF